MSSLHTLHLGTNAAVRRASDGAQPDDVLLLREDAVLLALGPQIANAPFAKIFALAADLDARGIRSRLPATVNVIDDSEFVALTLQHERVIAWR